MLVNLRARFGADSNIFTFLATCLADFVATSAWDELLQNIFSGALSKIHCSNLLGKLHCSCIFKTGYSILLVNLHARFGADSNIFTCLATCLAIFFATSAWDELLRNIFSGVLSKIHCSNLLGKLHCSCNLKACYSSLLVKIGARFGADFNGF